MKKYKYVGSEGDSRDYTDNQPTVGKVYNEDVIIGSKTSVLEWATDSDFKHEWEEVFEGDSSQQASYYVGAKNWISCKIETVIDGKSVVSEFGTNDLEEFKKFVGNLI